MTLKQLASAIRNHVVDGLDGISATSFSTEQLEDEVLLAASSSIAKLTMQGLIDIGKLTQRIDGIPIVPKDLSTNCQVESEQCAPHFEIPNVNRAAENPIMFLGSFDSRLVLKVYYDRDYRYHKYRLATSNRPFAWVSTSANTNGLYDVFLFNMSKYNNIKFLSMDILLDNPYDLLGTDYFEQFASSEFYAPLYIQEEIIDRLTQKYVNYYRQLHMQQAPNTQQA
jgi:hypothetical protein